MTTAENLQEVPSPCPLTRGFGRVVRAAAAFLLVLSIPDAAALRAEEPGPTLEAVRAALAEKRTEQTEVRGFQLGKQTFRDVPADGGLLIGFNCGVGKFMNSETVYALRPVYLTVWGEMNFQDHGLFWGQRQVGNRIFRSQVLRIVNIRAKPGYAVGAVTLRTGLNIDGLSVTFMRIRGRALDPKDFYTSEWVGNRTGGSESTLGGTGALVVGVVGNKNEEKVSALGLVLVKQPARAIRAPDVLLPKEGVVERPVDVPHVIPPPAPLRVEPPPTAPETTPAPAPADKKALPTTQVAEGMGWLPFAIFGVVTIAFFAVLVGVFGLKRHGLKGEPGRRARPVRKPPRRPASQGTDSRNRREKADPLSGLPYRLEHEAIPEVLPADPEPAPETRRHERAPQPFAWDEDFVAQWLANLSFPPEDQDAEAPADSTAGAAQVIG
jgi:hypothetical protein